MPRAPAKIKEREKRKSEETPFLLSEIFSQYPIAQIAINLIIVNKSFDKLVELHSLLHKNCADLI